MSELEKEVRIKAFNLGMDLDSATKMVLRETSEKMDKGDIRDPFDYITNKGSR